MRLSTAGPGGLSLWRVTRALRRWFAVPVILAIVAAALGAGVASLAQPTAETRLMVQTTTQDASAMQRIMETAVQQTSTSSVFAAAAKASGADPEDLRSRTRVAAVPNSLVLTVTVTAADPERAVRESQAVASAAVSASAAQTQAELDRLTEATLALLNDPDAKADNPTAERARIARLGDELAGNQSNLVANSDELMIIEGPISSGPTISTTTLGALAAAGGAMLGMLLVVLVGYGRGPVVVRDLPHLYPETTILAPHQVPTVLALETDPVDTIIIGGTHTSSAVMEAISQSICDAVVLTGGNAYLSGQARPVLGPWEANEAVPPAPVHNQTIGTRRATRAREDMVSVIPTDLNQVVMRRTLQSPGSLLFIIVEPGTTRLEWLDRFLSKESDRIHLLVPEESAPWKT